jgi:hypothetical protein
LNRPSPTIADIPPAEEQLPINTNPPTKAEIIKAIKYLENGKASRPRWDPPGSTQNRSSNNSSDVTALITKDMRTRTSPCKLGHIIKLPKKGDLS